MTIHKHSATELQIGSLSCVKIENVSLFDVSKVFDCGQSFRFDRVSTSEHENDHLDGVVFKERAYRMLNPDEY